MIEASPEFKKMSAHRNRLRVEVDELRNLLLDLACHVEFNKAEFDSCGACAWSVGHAPTCALNTALEAARVTTDPFVARLDEMGWLGEMLSCAWCNFDERGQVIVKSRRPICPNHEAALHQEISTTTKLASASRGK